MRAGLFQRATSAAESTGLPASRAIYHGVAAISEALVGDRSRARSEALAGLALSDARDITYAAAFALARIGDTGRAIELAASLEKRFPEDTSVRYNYLPTLRAMAAARGWRHEDALTLLEVNRPYEFAVNGLAFQFYIGALYPMFIRAEAYESLARKEEAVAEYRRILSHRGLLLADPVGAVIERRLADLAPRP